MAILLNNITKKYKMKKILSNVSLSFDSKGLVILTGENGSGKTTLLNILGLLDEKYEGQISINNIAISSLKKNQINQLRGSVFNFIFQESNLIDDLTVQDNLSLFKKMKGIDSNEASFINNVDSLLPKYPATLSGGERQKIAITRGLFDGDIILCDEPVASLDYQSTIEVMDKLKEISKSKLVIVVMHDRELVELYADRIIELKNGNVISDNVIAETEELKASVEIKKINIKQSIFKLICSFFKKRPLKSFMFLFIMIVFLTLLSLTFSLLTYDPVDEIASRLIAGDSVEVNKRMWVENEVTEQTDNYVFKNGNIIYSDVIDKFNNYEYDYIINSIYGDVYFSDNLNLEKGEALVDLDTYYKITHVKEFQAGHTLNISNLDIGIQDIHFNIIGIINKKGIFASKLNLEKKDFCTYQISLNCGMFLNNKMTSFTDYYYDSLPYISLSYFKEVMLNKINETHYNSIEEYQYAKSIISDMYLNENEMGIGSALLEYIDGEIENEISLSFYDLTIFDESFRKQFVNLKDTLYQEGATVPYILPNNFESYNGRYIVVNDNAFSTILSLVPCYNRICIPINDNNKTKIAEFYLNNDFIFLNKQLDYILNIPNTINTLEALIICLIVLFIISLFIVLNLFSSNVLISKRNEIGLLQSFGFSKSKSLLPSFSIIIIVFLLSLGLSLILSPSIFAFTNKFAFPNTYHETPIFIFNFKLVLFFVLSILLIIIFVIIFSYIKLRKYSAKDIFKIS